MLDKVAEIAKTLKGSDGNLIPIIYRPFHENNRACFWWGQTNAAKNTADDFKKIWQHTVHYLRDIKGVHNFLYAYSPNAGYANLNTKGSFVTSYMDTYPGDDYVDVWGVDDYYNIDDPSRLQNFADRLSELVLEAEKRGKIPAITEFGLQNNGLDKDNNFLMDRLLNPIKGVCVTSRPASRRLAYMLAWANH
ncbi:mannan endo-1,4-beta-mannosidase-like [Liolophura sinensis]|uniref:mannan endo-1,4-beta-mannosidase-like n=1 Tax=Liolophura sinensis TaxID=3198878 RepID=UPI0031589C9C